MNIHKFSDLKSDRYVNTMIFRGHDDYAITISEGKIIDLSQGNNYAGCSCESCGGDRYDISTNTITCKNFKECFKTNFNMLSANDKQSIYDLLTDQKVRSLIKKKVVEILIVE